MRVLCLPSDFSGCGFIRLRWVSAALKAQGADVTIQESLPAIWQRTADGDRVVGVDASDADVVVWQRVFRRELLTVMRGLKAQGVANVIDVDDDFSTLHPRHPMYASLHPRTHPDRSWAVLAEAVKLADVVTVSTPALARRYGGVLVRNCIPRAYLGIERQPASSTPVIGWPGTPLTHPCDLETVGEAVANVCKDGTARFRAIGSRSTLDVLGVPDQQHQPGVTLANLDYARALARLDVGIAPLSDSAFGRAKSWLKPLEMASVGVPWVASALPEYEALYAMGGGVLVRRPREWERELRRLAGSADLRAVLSAQGRAAAAGLTIEDHYAPRVWDAWKSAVRRPVVVGQLQPHRRVAIEGHLRSPDSVIRVDQPSPRGFAG